ncbi:hypothetical protein INR49_026991 [Caranx melampygus]|nr:hypothetical protein INR49_026991 [Caranx melampygus]
MDEIYVNLDEVKPDKSNISTNPTGPRSSESRCHGAVVLSLSLLSVFLLAGLIGLAVHYYNLTADFSSVKASLSERLQISDNKSLSLTEERDQLNSTLIKVTNERDRLQSLSEHKKTCPSGWTLDSGSCYLFSTESGSWDKGREDCRGRGADLVVIDSAKETSLLGFTSDAVWIGLTDKEKEGVWKWVDGTPLTLAYWADNEPNNAGGVENCAYVRSDGKRYWNDASCPTSSERRCHGAVVLSLSLLSVFLLAGLIGLGVHYYNSAAELSSVKASLSERLQISDNKSLALTEERDQLNSTLTEVTKELHSLSERSPTRSERRCHGAVFLSLSLNVFLLAGFLGLSIHYHGLAADLSSVKANLSKNLQKSLSLTEERDRLNSIFIEVAKGLDLIQSLSQCNEGLAAELSSVKASLSERLHKSLSLTKERDQLNSTLNEVTKERDRFQRLYWDNNEPNNEGGVENCAHTRSNEKRDWNDAPCDASFKWICEKKAL